MKYIMGLTYILLDFFYRLADNLKALLTYLSYKALILLDIFFIQVRRTDLIEWGFILAEVAVVLALIYIWRRRVRLSGRRHIPRFSRPPLSPKALEAGVWYLFLTLLVITSLALWTVPERQLAPHQNTLSEKDYLQLKDQFRKTWAIIMGGEILLMALYLTYRRTRSSERQIETFMNQLENSDKQVKALEKQVQIVHDEQIMERFTRAVEQLGNQDISIRLSGIYTLEHLANDSDRGYWTIMEVLAAYVRGKSPLRPDQDQEDIFLFEASGDESRLPVDIQAALTVMGRCENASKENAVQGLDLRGTHLQRADFQKAKLQRAQFWEADLRGADLNGANLKEADLRQANLVRASLQGAKILLADLRKARLLKADLHGADLWRANLQEADLQAARLTQTDLREANLRLANLQGVDFQGASLEVSDLQAANLQGADFRKAKLNGANLQSARLNGARNLTLAHLSMVRTLHQAQLDWPLENQVRKLCPHLLEEPPR